MRKSISVGIGAAMLLAGAAFAAAMPPQFVTVQSADMLSTNVVGLDVYDMQNNDIGKIKDIAFDSNRTVKGYVLSVAGILGLGSRYVAVDTGSVAIKYDNADKCWHANMEATKDQLKAAPEFKFEG